MFIDTCPQLSLNNTSQDADQVNVLLEAKKENPFVGCGCVMNFGSHPFPYGGHGSFINKAALQRMTQPIFCEGKKRRTKDMEETCATLRKNRAGELFVFDEGDSVFDIFYKYSALKDFCVHSDWIIGFMFSYYSGANLEQVKENDRCKLDNGQNRCSRDSATCHYMNPERMKKFALSRSLSKFVSVVLKAQGNEKTDTAKED